MKIKTLFNLGSKLFDWLWNINLILGLAAIIFVSVNAFTNKKAITASYLGNFKISTEQVGQLNSELANSQVYINDIVGAPSILINSKINTVFIFVFVLFVISIVLFYNYQLKQLFITLKLNISEGTPFGNGISKRFISIAQISLSLCVVGTILSLLKVFLVNNINFNGLTLTPVFDSKILNLLWIGLASFIISGIFKTGCELKQENDLTI